MNRFGHVDLRVPDLAAAKAFYDVLMPALGYTVSYHSPAWLSYATPDALPAAAYMAVTEAKDHVPNANRLAFWAPDDAVVDRLAEVARAAGARDFEAPEKMPYGPTPYYAAYFADPGGNRLEIYCRLPPP